MATNTPATGAQRKHQGEPANADRKPAANPRHGSDEAAKFLDVQLEALIFDVDAGIRALGNLQDRDKQQDQLKEICRVLREAKLHFNEVLERYGADYEDFGQHLVDIAYVASDRAATLRFEQLHKSLERHAKDIEKAQLKGKEMHSA